MKQVRSLLSKRGMLRGYSFEPRPNSNALGTINPLTQTVFEFRHAFLPVEGCVTSQKYVCIDLYVQMARNVISTKVPAFATSFSPT